MGKSQLARCQATLLLMALGLCASLSLNAQEVTSPGAVSSAASTQAAASAASAVAEATAAATAAVASGAPTAAPSPNQGASSPTGQCPAAAAPYCQRVSPGWLWLVLSIYAAAFAAVRWYLVARPHLYNLEGQIEALRQWAAVNPKGTTNGPDDQQIEQLLKRVEDLVAPEKHSLLDKLLWSRGRDLAGLHLFYQAWELLVARRSPESLRCYLEEAALAPPNADAAAADLAQRIKVELQREPLDLRDAGQATLHELRVYLARFDAELDSEIDRLVVARSSAAPPTAAEALTLVKRVSEALRPPPAMVHRLAHTHNLPPLWQQLIEHARDVTLPGAVARQHQLDALVAAPPAIDSCLDALSQSIDQRRALQGLATRLATALSAAPLAPSERRIELAREAMAGHHHSHLSQYDMLLTWHRKSLWLGMATLLLVLLLALAAGNHLLFLMGAFGGLLSRIRLAVTNGGLGESRDLHWTSLLLSPLLGALAAWGGLLLISLAVHFGVLGTTFSPLVWEAPMSPVLLGVALMLGFAERLFLDVASRIQVKFEPPAAVTQQGSSSG